MAKEMIFTRLEPAAMSALKKAAETMPDMKPSRLMRIIIMDWLDKYAPKNNLK